MKYVFLPTIGLERIGQLDILSKLFKPIVIPDEANNI